MSFDYFVIVLLVLIVLITTIAILILVERKLLAISQRRVGPSILGRRGFLQIIADVIKPLFKEIFEQKFQTITLISFFIYILFLSQLIYLSFFSFGINGVLYDNVDFIVLLQLGASGLSCLSILIIGYLSNTKYGMIGSIRMVISDVSINIVVVLLNSIVLLNTSSLDFTNMCYNQGMVPNITLLFNIYSIVYIIHLFITSQRAPLDFIENEAELVAGYNTEYSGPDVLVIYFAEYLHIVNGVLQFICLMFGFSITFDINFIFIDSMISFVTLDCIDGILTYISNINYIDL